jgi:hypothetical protein
MQAKLLKHIDNAKLEKASAYQLVGSLALLYDKERLERGQSTQNVSYDARVISASIAELRELVKAEGNQVDNSVIDVEVENKSDDAQV